MASNSSNPVARFYEAQTAATAEIVQAALSGGQRLQQITVQAMRGAGGSGDAADLQRDLLQAIMETNSAIVRASYSMMEQLRDAFGTAMPGTSAPSGADAMSNPMALYEAAMRQWQTMAQQMMQTPSVAMAVASATKDDSPARGRSDAASTSTRPRSTARKSSARKR